LIFIAVLALIPSVISHRVFLGVTLNKLTPIWIALVRTVLFLRDIWKFAAVL